MPITITRARVKEKCSISDTAYDTTIDNLILELTPVLEFLIEPSALASSDPGLQATLNLAATEVACGELLTQRNRESGASEAIAFEGIKISPTDTKLAQAIIGQGYARLEPYFKADAGMPVSRVMYVQSEPEE